MILTFKVKHHRDFSHELCLARKIAEFALRSRSQTSKDVKHIGLKSMIANQILRKYSRNRKAKKVTRVVLTIPNQGIKVDKVQRKIWVPCIKLLISFHFRTDFEKINQIELNGTFAMVSVTINEPKERNVEGFIGVDRNTTGHVAVVGNPTTGKVWKLGKKAQHIHTKYKNLRRIFQKNKISSMFKKIKNRESHIIRDLNHKISRKIINIADSQNVGIVLEDLQQIRHNTKVRKSFMYSLHSWSYYRLEKMIRYKAKLLGIPVFMVEPAYTSKSCSRCGELGKRRGKLFECPVCGHVDHADCNASFNIALRQFKHDRLSVDRDAFKGSTDTPQEAMVRTTTSSEPNVCQHRSMSV
jgi:putative transposase